MKFHQIVLIRAGKLFDLLTALASKMCIKSRIFSYINTVIPYHEAKRFCTGMKHISVLVCHLFAMKKNLIAT